MVTNKGGLLWLLNSIVLEAKSLVGILGVFSLKDIFAVVDVKVDTREVY